MTAHKTHNIEVNRTPVAEPTTPGTLRITIERGSGGVRDVDMEAYGFGVSEGVLTVSRSSDGTGDRNSTDAMFYALSHVVSWYWLSKPEKIKKAPETYPEPPT